MLQTHLPFAVVGSVEDVKVGNKMVKARLYPWGSVQGESNSAEFIRQLQASENSPNSRGVRWWVSRWDIIIMSGFGVSMSIISTCLSVKIFSKCINSTFFFFQWRMKTIVILWSWGRCYCVWTWRISESKHTLDTMNFTVAASWKRWASRTRTLTASRSGKIKDSSDEMQWGNLFQWKTLEETYPAWC